MKHLTYLLCLMVIVSSCIGKQSESGSNQGSKKEVVTSASFKKKEKEKLNKKISDNYPEAGFSQEDVETLAQEVELTEEEKESLNFVSN